MTAIREDLLSGMVDLIDVVKSERLMTEIESLVAQEGTTDGEIIMAMGLLLGHRWRVATPNWIPDHLLEILRRIIAVERES
jgi:hypothetical protein